MSNKKGTLFVISGSSGTGKGTVLELLLKQSDKFCYSVSATTRAPREGEIEGLNYYFVSREQFEEFIKKGEMLEHAEYVENLYGTPKSYVLSQLEKGMNVILEIEVCGARQIKEKFPEAVLIFITPPSFAELEKRLLERKTESKEVIEQRLKIALTEIQSAKDYDYIILNNDNKAIDAAMDIISIAEGKYNKNTDPDYADKFISDFIKNNNIQ
ncbi:MAG: guanylate kinase [Clostridiales bacterium GWF2_36_10]|nr:MAG: guanylate kinase [Clostridiales bacterium GWF2_36_10]